jgi:pimeloyl-ACP methyl ester carboxylesterase
MLILLVLAACMSLSAQTGIEGSWEGPLKTPGGTLRLRLHVSRSTSGVLTAKVDSVDQGAFGLQVDSVSFADRMLRFDMRALQASFQGLLDENGRKVVGSFRQGMDLPLTLTRLDKAPEPPKRPQEPKPPVPYDAVDVTVENSKAGVKLAATLTLPKAKGPHPAVVLISGSGPQDRDETVMGHRVFLVLADHLTRSGVAVLRYDDRGVGKSTGDFGSATTPDFAVDASAAVDYLKTRTEIDAKRIGLIGHSEGAVVAPMAANQRSDLAFLVLLAPTAVTGSEVIRAQSRAIGKTMKANDAALDKQDQQLREMHRIVREEKNPSMAAGRLKDSGVGEAQIRMLTSPWFRYFLTYDPAPALAKLKLPVLVLNGELDLQVLPDQNLPVVESSLTDAGNTQYKIMRMPGLNHLFQTAKTGSPGEYAQIEETFAPAALEAISSWIQHVPAMK